MELKHRLIKLKSLIPFGFFLICQHFHSYTQEAPDAMLVTSGAATSAWSIFYALAIALAIIFVFYRRVAGCLLGLVSLQAYTYFFNSSRLLWDPFMGGKIILTDKYLLSIFLSLLALVSVYVLTNWRTLKMYFLIVTPLVALTSFYGYQEMHFNTIQDCRTKTPDTDFCKSFIKRSMYH